ncbi:hypothetical protein TWF106_010276 [Orbilia oligospora]|uniref:Uncharacterized protein n=1 Tax=Orbilia oligospora TaxID=2813651 RepID=A0A7C8QPG9_ORBOL|nr:hypothetical protein TWF106_010276 [Orbilia oligospora]KAF3219221.1 hypothetical protein TWF191_008015 [Orbilia oligospora]
MLDESRQTTASRVRERRKRLAASPRHNRRPICNITYNSSTKVANAHGSDNHHNFIPQVLDFRGLITLPLSLQLSNQQHNTHGQGQL